jgi:predicted SprT family Zn-dependent metalloprotease
MKIIWSPLITITRRGKKEGILGFIDSDGNVNLSYCILGQKHPILAEIACLFHELTHLLTRNNFSFDKLWDELWKLLSKSFGFVVSDKVLQKTVERMGVYNPYETFISGRSEFLLIG